MLVTSVLKMLLSKFIYDYFLRPFTSLLSMSFYQISLFAIMLVCLSGCQGGGGGSSASGSGVVSGSGGVAGIQIGGSAADGPVAGGIVEFQDAYGTGCGATVETDDGSHYAALIPLECSFPLQMSLTGGLDMVVGDDNYTKMLSLVLDSSSERGNITPLTTIIYYAAQARSVTGGLAAVSVDDLDFATRVALRYFNFGIDNDGRESGMAYDPVTAKIGDSNVCAFVKANEGLIEAVRRTVLYLGETTSLSSSAVTDVLATLGRDISDGILDGSDLDGILPDGAHTAAIWNLNAATVSMELMKNQFTLTASDGSIITKDNSYSRLAGAAEKLAGNAVFVNSDIDNVGVSLGFIKQARAAATSTDILLGGNTDYAIFADSLMQMEREIALGTGRQIMAAATVDQMLPTKSSIISGINQVNKNVTEVAQTVFRSNVTKAESPTSTSIYDDALAGSYAVDTESISVPVTQRQMHIEWSYPNSASNINGFKINIEVADAYDCGRTADKLQTCIVKSPTARSADCAVDVAPGELIKVSMTATTSTSQESASSAIYENTLPLVEFKTDKLAGNCPLWSTFIANTAVNLPDSIRDYDWDFGDGSALGADPYLDHEFTFSGSYHVVLTVTDTVGKFAASGQAALDIDCR